MPYEPINSLSFTRGANFSRSRLAPELAGYLAEGSWNTLFLGDGYFRPFRGLDSQGANTGSRVMRPVGKTWGGIKDNGVTVATGSISEEIGRSLWGIGSGQVHVEGTNVTGFTLSTLLKLSLLSSGAYQTPVNAGLTQPSAPSIGVSTDTGDPSGALSCKIEGRRPATGGRSRASSTSVVVVPAGNKVRVTYPLAGAATHFRTFFTLMRFGGEGIHYALAYNDQLDIPEATIAAGTVDGIARSLLFNWKDGDLVADEASFDDYAPQAGTHLIRLETVMNICGSLADAVTAPTSTNTGTAIQVSKTNNYESYVPTHLLFLPEQVVDVLSRPIDSYGLIACENSINAIQFVGPRGDDLPACTITTIIPDIGIKYPHNWTHFRGRVCLYTAEGNLLMMTETGDINTEFSGPIRRYIKDWLPADTIVGYCPKNDLIVIGNGGTLLCYSLETGEWTAVYLPDYGITSDVLACQAAQRRLFISLENSAAYEFDYGASAPVPVSFVSHFTNQPNASAAKNIYQMSLAIESNMEDSPVVVCLAKNLQQIAFRDIVTNGTKTITTSSAKFTDAMGNAAFALFGTDIGGAGIPYIKGFVTYVSSSTLDLKDEFGADLIPSASLTDCLMFLGDYTEVETMTAQNSEHLSDFFPTVHDARSYAAAIWFLTDDTIGSVLDINLFGTLNATTRI